MMIDVHLTDGRTVIRLRCRAELVTLICRDLRTIDSNPPIAAWVDRGRGEGFEYLRLQQMSKNQVGWVEHFCGAERDAFLQEHDPGLLASFHEKERLQHALDAAEARSGEVAAA